MEQVIYWSTVSGRICDMCEWGSGCPLHVVVCLSSCACYHLRFQVGSIIYITIFILLYINDILFEEFCIYKTKNMAIKTQIHF